MSLSCTPKPGFVPGMHLNYVESLSFFNRVMLYSRIGDIEDNKSGYHSTLNQSVKKLSNTVHSLYNRAITQPPQENSYFRQKLKNFCKKNCLKIILLILLVGLTSGLGSCIGTSFANTVLHVCKSNIHCPYVMPEMSNFELDEEDVELQSKKFICLLSMPKCTPSLLREKCKRKTFAFEVFMLLIGYS